MITPSVKYGQFGRSRLRIIDAETRVEAVFLPVNELKERWIFWLRTIGTYKKNIS